MLQHDASGKFVKGGTPWNKGKFGYMGANRTSFTKEDAAKRRVIGKVSNWSGYMVRVTEDKTPKKSRNGKVYMSQRRIGYAKWLIEQKIGRSVDSRREVIYHKDLNPLNNDISNLELITRAELLRRNSQNKN